MGIIQQTSRVLWSFLSYFIILLLPLTVNAQELNVSAKLDTNQIKIGKHAHLILKATTSSKASVVFPTFKDTITDKIELVSESKIDTFKAGNQVTYQKELVITAFDSGYFAIPPFKFHTKEDSSKSFETDALLFTVQTVSVDTTLAIKGIKAPIDPAWSIFEIQNEILIGLLALLIIFIVVYYLRTRKKTEVVIERPVFTRPAHEIAIEALIQLREQKLWQQGRVKEYHIVISDTVRTYIEHRYSIGAMEMTSDEIMRSLRLIIVEPELKVKLSSLLILSDMVKFAKEQPLPNENEMSWEHAIEFVKLTALIQEKEELKS
jgi:carbon starvation protein CstA